MHSKQTVDDYDVRQLLRDTILYIGLWPVIAIVGCHLSYAAAALNLPLHDSFFMAIFT